MYQPPKDIPESMRHYFCMWNEIDPTLIRGHLDLAISEDCIWVDPQNSHVGRIGLENNVKAFRAKYPTAELDISSNVDGHNNRFRYNWIISEQGKTLMRGFDVATLNDDGLVERVDGFFGELVPTK